MCEIPLDFVNNSLGFVKNFFAGLCPALRQGYRPGPSSSPFTDLLSTPDRASSLTIWLPIMQLIS